MTKVFQSLEEEKLEAVNIAKRNERYDTNVEIAKSLLRDGIDTVVIMRATGFSKEQIEEIRNNMLTTKQGIRTGCHLPRGIWQSFCILSFWKVYWGGSVFVQTLILYSWCMIGIQVRMKSYYIKQLYLFSYSVASFFNLNIQYHLSQYLLYFRSQCVNIFKI